MHAASSRNLSKWKYTPSCRKRRRKAEWAKRVRKQFQCPVDGCSGRVTYLRRHIHQVHKEIPDQEIHFLSKKNTNRSRRKLQMWKCPVDDCVWSGDRLDKHLSSKIHGYEKADARRKAKDARLQQPVSFGIPRRVSSTSYTNCSSLSDSFLKWYGSIQGGNNCSQFSPRSQEERKVGAK